MATCDYERILKHVLIQMKRHQLVNKPHLIHIIQQIENNISRRKANEIIKQMVLDRKIDEHLALSKRQRPYSFYMLGAETSSLKKMTLRLFQVLRQKKELSITDASRLTGYSQLVVRTLLTHLLLEGMVDYRGNLDSPVFYIPWDAK